MMNSTFKIGDIITIRGDLQEGTVDLKGDSRYSTDSESIVDKMLDYRGMSATIKDITSIGKYSLDIDDGFWSWTHHMFEEGKEPKTMEDIEVGKDGIRFKIGEKVTIRRDLTMGMEFMEEERDGYKEPFTQDVTTEMISLGGQTATIMSINPMGEYNIDLDNGDWEWTHHMFEEGDRLDIQRQMKEQSSKTITSSNSCEVKSISLEKGNKVTPWEVVYTKPNRVEQLDKLVDTIVDRLIHMDFDFEENIRLDRMIIDMSYAKDIKDISVDEKEAILCKVLMVMKDMTKIVVDMSDDAIILNFA